MEILFSHLSFDFPYVSLCCHAEVYFYVVQVINIFFRLPDFELELVRPPPPQGYKEMYPCFLLVCLWFHYFTLKFFIYLEFVLLNGVC